MGNVIRQNAAAPDILRDVELTLSNAVAKGSPYQQDAERFLTDPATQAVLIAEKILADGRALDALKSRQRMEDQRCNDLVGRVKDDLYNVVGRPASDPVFNRIFPGGIAAYTGETASNKPVALELLATLLETHRHLLIPDALVASLAAELRAQAGVLEGVNATLGPARSALRVVNAQYTANARHAQLQLVRLKKYWTAIGVSEADIHLIIPDRPREPAQARAATTGSTGSSEISTGPTLATGSSTAAPPAEAGSEAAPPVQDELGGDLDTAETAELPDEPTGEAASAAAK